MEHLIETNGSEEHIAIVRESLKSEGWKDLGNKLPKLWLFKTEKHSRQLKFLTERGNLAISKIGHRKYLEEDKEDLKYHEGDEDNVVRTEPNRTDVSLPRWADVERKEIRLKAHDPEKLLSGENHRHEILAEV